MAIPKSRFIVTEIEDMRGRCSYNMYETFLPGMMRNLGIVWRVNVALNNGIYMQCTQPFSRHDYVLIMTINLKYVV